jgi:dihydroorotate dehydrogenase electron transfer subunit
MDAVALYPATSDCLREILKIERISFPSPWDEDTFVSTMGDERCIAIVAVADGMVVGYCISLILTAMVHILNLAVHPDYRRKGTARLLVEGILQDALRKDKTYAVLEVRKSNTSARLLYVSMGFSHMSTWHRYYTDTNEDAAIMVKDLRVSQVRDVECRVVGNREVAGETYLMTLKGEFPLSSPGQFAMVQVSSSHEPFLRRPLAILSQDAGHQEFLYRVRGEGTRQLSRKCKGETVRLLGPLGKGFTRHDGKEIIYVAGGTGLPPVFSLADRIRSGRFILGAKSVCDIPVLERLMAIPNTEIIVMTEDGSAGGRGLATDALQDVMAGMGGGDDIIVYSCGPEGMLRETSRIAAEAGVLCEVSLEERMSCGFGACTGCIARTIRGNMRVCREGPVFNAYDIIWR